jgi:hypothetical protein
MPDTKDSVGEGCANLVHDVALAQPAPRRQKRERLGSILSGALS